jgi:hypothetical protein
MLGLEAAYRGRLATEAAVAALHAAACSCSGAAAEQAVVAAMRSAAVAPLPTMPEARPLLKRVRASGTQPSVEYRLGGDRCCAMSPSLQVARTRFE